MPSFTRTHVRTYAAALFPQESPELVLELLDHYGTEPHERERERVHMAILFLSEGKEDALLYYIEHGKQDYRDVLYWAEYDKGDTYKLPQQRRDIVPPNTHATFQVGNTPLDLQGVQSINDECYYIELLYQDTQRTKSVTLIGSNAQLLRDFLANSGELPHG